ncbi:SRPBCC family protein [Clostridium sp. MSJ-4]|uniref:SRPBCC family protein n=1 Tax=Clostridium simiarum TaxID=2841506 RepID=A0ABS6EVB8_9CLOT|nr:SRPBCC family protein [Clostridium simiarum]MBU5590160.1 SRPBCC family protein [Clostridium simiarum]
MAVANIKLELNGDIQTVWGIVTSLEDYTWRSDLSKVEVLEAGKKFIEYTKNGYSTTFTITKFEPLNRYEFDMDNENMHGNWIGVFSKSNGKTIIDFTENVTPKKMIMKPFVGLYLKKQQSTYVSDLKRLLEDM